ncbi:MAG: Hpt domain-containing protein [Acetobacteraceae bacterium]|nr:Hpt domain-containing protein [Acetobacteraceae bacterium]
MGDLGFAAQLAEDLSAEDLRLVLTVFRTDVQRLSGALGEAARAADPAGFRRAAHGLAGAAGAVGAGLLEQACRRVMAQGGLAPDARMEEMLAEIEAVARDALGDLDAFLARHAALPPRGAAP